MLSDRQPLARFKFFTLAAALGCIVAVASLMTAHAEPTPAAKANSPHHLQTALGVNVDYCQEWLDGGDLKSLKQTAEGLLLLADVLQARSGDPAWQKGIGELRSETAALIKSAGGDKLEECRQQLPKVAAAAARLAAQPFPGEAADYKNLRPAAGLKSMMVLLDGTHADAKRAVLFDEFASARESAATLAELGMLLANYRGDAQWKKHADAFIGESEKVAQLTSDDAQVYRNALGGIYNQCEACHNRR